MHAIIREFADVIDTNMPEFIVEEDRSLQTKMIIKKKKVEEGDEFYPFDDEIQHRFYRALPDISRFVIQEKEGSG